MRTKTFEQVSISYRFYVPDNRRRDLANMVQSQKPAIDGLVDAGLLKDDCWQFAGALSAVAFIDRDRPRVEIVIEEIVNNETTCASK